MDIEVEIIRKKRKRSDSVLWKKPLHPQKKKDRSASEKTDNRSLCSSTACEYFPDPGIMRPNTCWLILSIRFVLSNNN